jgi:polysaccharide biosynthesis transport protein
VPEVIVQVGDQLRAEERIPANLLEMVDAQMASIAGARGDSDLIRITATADAPEKAAAIANAWAKAYVSEVNTIYGQVPDEVLASIQTELNNAQQTYMTNQANLEAFLATNQIDVLTSQVTLLQQRVNQEATLQQGLLKQWQDAQQQLNTARALRIQTEQGGDAAARSNMAALQVLKMSVYSLPPEKLTVEVRDIPQVTSAGMLADLDGLITSLTGQLQALETQITALSAPSVTVTGTTPSLVQTFAELRAKKSQLETETAKQLQLTQQRDLSWDTYKTVNSKVAELNLARAAASSEVRFGAPAVAPVTPIKKYGLILASAGAGLVGFLVAIFYTFLANYLGKAPFLASTSAKAV